MSASHNVNEKRLQLQQKQQNRVKTICLTMIVKNESKNMVRCLDSLKSIIDFALIVDTGSTDNTVEIIEKWFVDNNIKGKVEHEPFKNFGYNRTDAVRRAQKTWSQADYLLLSDADFIWNISKQFNKKLLFDHKYLVVQRHKELVYSNIRMLSAKIEWICHSATHEFFQEDTGKCAGIEIRSHLLKSLEICDMEDGGCKDLKFIRDEQLLLEQLAIPDLSEELKSRSYFYLAQTYKCLQRYEESIDYYKKRVAMGLWQEETFYSMYQIGICYQSLYSVYKTLIEISVKDEKVEWETQFIEKWNKDNLDIDALTVKKQECLDAALLWYIDGWKFRPSRAESLYQATSLAREVGLHQQAYDYTIDGIKIPFSSDSLFLEANAYKRYSWMYERSIVCYYLNKHEEGNAACEEILDDNDAPDYMHRMAVENSKFYI